MDGVSLFIALVSGLLLSLIGSIPMGMINMMAANISFRNGLTAAYWFAAGAAFVEFFQSIIAIRMGALMEDNPAIEQNLTWIAATIFSALSLYFLTKKNKEINYETAEVKVKNGFFLKGMAISMMNVMVFPYWFFYSAWLESEEWLSFDTAHLLIFSTGVMIGGWLVLAAYAKLAARLVKKKGLQNSFSKIIGFVFLVLAIMQWGLFWQRY